VRLDVVVEAGGEFGNTGRQLGDGAYINAAMDAVCDHKRRLVIIWVVARDDITLAA